MSIIFGVKKPRGDRITQRQVLELAQATDRWAPDGTFVDTKDEIGMGFQPFHTHRRSTLESQPVTDAFGNMVTLDGRLDNHQDLRKLLGIAIPDVPDSQIALAAFGRWGEDCFAKFIGDWALAIWSQADGSLYLARDHAGTRTLYFEQRNGTLLWATFLETFFRVEGSRDLNEEYASCYLACQPIGDLTPYKGIAAVTPAHFVVVRQGQIVRKAHWRPASESLIKYRNDHEYEEQFVSLLEEAVRRRIASTNPVLAHLSGGIDSTSIVCVSDHLCRKGIGPQELIDTVSYYDNSDPAWDETPYFTFVEEMRQKSGIHIDASRMHWVVNTSRLHSDVLLPGGDNPLLNCDYSSMCANDGRDYRVVLSGIGGDELLGGIATGLPELGDCLCRATVRSLLARSILWSVPDRVPLIHSLGRTIKFVLRQYIREELDTSAFPNWLAPKSVQHCRGQANTSRTLVPQSLARPSAINNARTWWSVLETQPHLVQPPSRRYEYRYPYLDRDFIDFVFRVPPEQLVAPGRRRYLMRRALRHVVPQKILERRRKASLARSPLTALRESLDSYRVPVSNFHLAERGLIKPQLAQQEIDSLMSGGYSDHWGYVIRLIKLEHWISGQGSSRFYGLSHHGSRKEIAFV